MFATLDFCKNLIMHHAEKNKNVIYRLGRSVQKNILFRSQKRPSAFGLGPFLRPRQNIFPVRTSHPVNNIYILFICIIFLRDKLFQTLICVLIYATKETPFQQYFALKMYTFSYSSYPLFPSFEQVYSVIKAFYLSSSN